MSQSVRQTGKSARTTTRPKWWCAVALVGAFAVMSGPCAAQAPADGGAASPSLDALARTRKQVQEYFEGFSDLTCKESVTQLVLNGSGRTIYRENSAYDYQFQTSQQNGIWKFNETRESRNPAFRDPARTLLVTTGFASLLLVAHPMYEASYEFEPDGAETIGGVSYLRIRFKPIPGATSPASLRLRGRNYPLPLSGTLWIEPQSGAVVKLEATVDSSLSDIGLAGMHSEVHFALHQFHEQEETVWVPESATIDVETPRQHWRNLHRFTAYKRFNVNVHEEIGQTQ
ncbi:MAG: hypothetical protein LAN18_03540 [Acidobacteriia bacterium]|nr:hypothetical protein [Terriglobia bacterium]